MSDAAAHLLAQAAALAQHDPIGAAERYQHVMAMDPQNAKAYYGLALLLIGAQQLEAAQELLAVSVDIDPGFLEAWFACGQIAQSQGDLPAAQAAFSRCVALKPDWVDAWRQLAQAQGETLEAAASHAVVAALQPNAAEAHQAVGAILARHGLTDEAAAAYRRAQTAA